MTKFTFLKTMLLTVVLLICSNSAKGDTFFSFTGTSGYVVPPATGWTSSGSGIDGGTYLKLSPGSVTSPAYSAATGITFTYDIAAFGSGTASNTILYILNSTDNSIITQYTLTSSSSSTYLTSQTVNVGSVTQSFKVKIEGLGNGTSVRGTRLRNYSLTGTPTVATPNISVTESSVATMSTNVGSNDSKTITVSGANLTGDISLAVSGTNADQFSVTPNTLTPSSGSVSSTVVTVKYTPTAAGSHSATLTLSSSGATNKTFSLTGSATYPPLSTPTANDATQVGLTGFTANWTAVSGATSYDLNVYTKTAGTNASDLFISEYIEGSSSNKYIEIFNGTGSTVDLSDYKLQLFTNGITTATNDVTLSGTLVNGASVVYRNTSATLTLPAGVTAIVNSAVNFNGDDAIALYKISTSSYVDIFGRIGEDPGTSWGTTPLITADKTLVRKSTVTGGVTTNPASGFPTLVSEWDSYNIDVATNLGSHSMVGGATSTPIANSPFNASTNSYAVSNLNPATEYFYTVVAKNANVTSSTSTEKSVTTTNDIAVVDAEDASTIPACPTCNVTVNNGGHLTVSGAKTYASVTVNPTAKLTVNDGVTLTAPVIIKSTASGTGTIVGNVSGTATVEQYLTGGRNWYISSPVTAGTLPSAGYEWNEAGGAWAPLSAAAAMTPGKGYIVQPAADITATFSGTLNNNITSATTLNRTTGATKEGFNLVGNPYPSYLNWNTITKTDLSATMWYRTKESSAYKFYTYNGTAGLGVPASVTNLIPPIQAFWVRVVSGKTSGSISFDNAARAHKDDSGNILKAPAATGSQIIRLTVSNGENTDETLIYTNSNATNGFDAFDSPKMMNATATVPDLYTMAGTEKLVINGMSALPMDTPMPLGFAPGKASTFSIVANELKNIDTNTITVVLRDALNNTDFDLSAGQAYSFASDATATENRFSLVLRSKGTTTGVVPNVATDNALVYADENSRICVALTEAPSADARITVFTISGQQLVSARPAGIRTTLDRNMQPGAYIVKTFSNGVETISKLTVK